MLVFHMNLEDEGWLEDEGQIKGGFYFMTKELTKELTEELTK